jgi:hypothetical protein
VKLRLFREVIEKYCELIAIANEFKLKRYLFVNKVALISFTILKNHLCLIGPVNNSSKYMEVLDAFYFGKKNENKVEICKIMLFLKETEACSLKNLSEQTTVSTVTIRNLIKEINSDLDGNIHIEIQNNLAVLIENNYNIEQIIDFYSLNDMGYKILESLLIKSNINTIPQLAQNLFISVPQVYKVIRSLNKHLLPYHVSIALDEIIHLKGTEATIKNVLYELISLSNKLGENLNMNPEKNLLRRQVNIIFAQYGIIASSSNIMSFANWILTCLNWRYVLKKKNVIITGKKPYDNYPFHLDTEFVEIGTTVLKNLGQNNSNDKEIRDLYLGLTNIVLKFSSPSDALFFQNNFIKWDSSDYKLKNFIDCLNKLIVKKNNQDSTNFPLDSYVLFILNYLSYFFISWKENLELYKYIYGTRPVNYDMVDKLCKKYLDLSDEFTKDVYIKHFCLMIDYYNLHNNDDILMNKRFIYESILGIDTENLMLAKIISLFGTTTNQTNPNIEYIYIVDDIRLIKDSHKKYMLLQDFLNYIKELF